jgi:Ca2+-binding EF-hand superfamily protein
MANFRCELRHGWPRLAGWDANHDGRLSWNELPQLFELTWSLGPPRRPSPASSIARSQEAAPNWFRNMDRNGDGDVSPREFLGPLEDFQKLDSDRDGLISPAETMPAR